MQPACLMHLLSPFRHAEQSKTSRSVAALSPESIFFHLLAQNAPSTFIGRDAPPHTKHSTRMIGPNICRHIGLGIVLSTSLEVRGERVERPER